MLRFPPRRILAAVDDSPVSMQAWRAARELARLHGARLEAVHVEPYPPEELYAAPRDSWMERERRAHLKRLLARMGPGAHLHSVRGDPAAALARLALERGCDLLVLGTHRRRGWRRLLWGSVAGDVVRRAPCPVLVVSRRWKALKAVVAPVNERDYAKPALMAAGLAARAHKVRLRLLHVITDPLFGPEPSSLLKSRLASLPREVLRDARPVARSTMAEKPVRDICRAAGPDELIVLAAHRRPALEEWTLGTTAERVIRGARGPVLAVPSPRGPA